MAAGELLHSYSGDGRHDIHRLVLAPNGDYSATPAALASAGMDNAPLHAPESSAVSGGNGVYGYGSSPAFPTSTYNTTNYWVDVVFTTTAR